MNRFSRRSAWFAFAGAAFLCLALCHMGLNSIIPAASASVAAAQDEEQDPASVNMAPSGPSYTTESAPYNDQDYEDSGYADQPVVSALAPPPPLPAYVQPPPPREDYIWVPGYWAWSPAGYYWVPGAWVQAPYEGALWTPGYWAFRAGRYWFHAGHWGQHIGFYGGINYGFGYFGIGYEGGFWNSGHFNYNRRYNNINDRVIHHVYNFDAGNRGFANRGGPGQGGLDRGVPNRGYDRGNPNRGGPDRGNFNPGDNNPRPSFHGGQNGVQVQPRPSDAAAWREPTAPRMNTQVQHEQNYQWNRGQFADKNNGQPAKPAIKQPIQADRDVTPRTHNQRFGTSPGGQPRGGSQPDQHR